MRSGGVCRRDAAVGPCGTSRSLYREEDTGQYACHNSLRRHVGFAAANPMRGCLEGPVYAATARVSLGPSDIEVWPAVNKIEVEEAQARDCASEFGSSGWTRAGL